jgi:hypothetical protein
MPFRKPMVDDTSPSRSGYFLAIMMALEKLAGKSVP